MPPGLLALTFHPVTPERLPGLARFLVSQGKFRYCACMRWRMPSSQFSRSTKEGRGDALEQLVQDGTPIGVLAYQAKSRDRQSVAQPCQDRRRPLAIRACSTPNPEATRH